MHRRLALLALAGLSAGIVALATPNALADDPALPGPTETSSVAVGFGARTITPHGDVPEPWAPYFDVNPVTGIWGEPFEDLDGDGCHDGATTANGEGLAEGEFFVPEPHIDFPWNHAGDGYLTGTFDVDGVTIVGDPQSAGKWDGLWAGAGFGSQCAEGVLDDTWARAVVFEQSDRAVAMVSLDVVGFLNLDVRRAQAELGRRYPELAGVKLVISSTHTHEAVDTMGYWGQTIGVDGKSPTYQAFIRSQLIDAVHEAWVGRAIARAKFATVDHTVGIRDSRDPNVIDPELVSAQFLDREGTVLGTIVNWSNHPEALGGNNGFISSDFPHATRVELEERFGGTAIYFTGSVGGLMTPLRVDIPGFGTGEGYDRMYEIGRLVASAAGDSLDAVDTVPLANLDIVAKDLFIGADNTALNGLNAIGVFDVPTFSGGDSFGADPTVWRDGIYSTRAGSQFRTEMVRVALDDVTFLTVPGELFPELEVGFTPLACAAAHTGAPDEPVIADHEDAAHRFVLGLGQDELGYIVPKRDSWFLHAEHPVTGSNHDGLVPVGALEADDPCGDGHYEETVSGSSTLAPWVTCVAAELAGHDLWNRHDACTRANTTVTPYGIGGSVLDGVFAHPGHDETPVFGAQPDHHIHDPVDGHLHVHDH